MKIAAVTIFYAESPKMMSEQVASIARFADVLVAVDGAIALFPGSTKEPASPPELSETIIGTAAAVGLPVLVHRPLEPFPHEMAKRNLSLDLARAVLGHDEDSWIVVVDSDHCVTFASEALRGVLAETDCIVASYAMTDRLDPMAINKDFLESARGALLPTVQTSALRAMYRALPSLHYGEAHYIVRATRDGEDVFLWTAGIKGVKQEPAFDASPFLRLDHRHHLRDRERKQAAKMYYRARDLAKIEDTSALVPAETA